MQFLKTLFWVALGIVVVLFSVQNWAPVTIELWGGLAADVKKPVLVLAVFLLGFLPTFLLFRTRLWSMRRKLEAAERNVVMAQMASASASDASMDTDAAIIAGADQRLTGQSSGGPA